MRSFITLSSRRGFEEKSGLTSVIFWNIFCAYAFVDISPIRTEELLYRGSQTLVLFK